MLEALSLPVALVLSTLAYVLIPLLLRRPPGPSFLAPVLEQHSTPPVRPAEAPAPSEVVRGLHAKIDALRSQNSTLSYKLEHARRLVQADRAGGDLRLGLVEQRLAELRKTPAERPGRDDLIRLLETERAVLELRAAAPAEE